MKTDPDEERVVETLLVNNLQVADVLTIYRYGDEIYVQPPKDFELDEWTPYNEILEMINGKWNRTGHRWEVPIPEG